MEKWYKKIISLGALGVVATMVLAPLYVYGDVYGASGNQKEFSSETLKGKPVLGIFHARSHNNKGSFCGLVEDEDIQPLLPSAMRVASAETDNQVLAFKEDFREAIAYHNVPLCDSVKDLAGIEQAANQMMIQNGLIEVAAASALGSLLGMTALTAAGTCVMGVSAEYFSTEYVKEDRNWRGSEFDEFSMGTLAAISFIGEVAAAIVGGVFSGVQFADKTLPLTKVVDKTKKKVRVRFEKPKMTDGAVNRGIGAGFFTGLVSAWAGFKCSEITYLIIEDEISIKELIPQFNNINININGGSYVEHPEISKATFVQVKAGTFLMGSPSDEKSRGNDEIQHKVTLTQDFEIQTIEVTQLQYFLVMGYNPSYFKKEEYCSNEHLVINGEELCPAHPVENVSWDDVQDFYCSIK